jgi:hypothetical protein
MSTRGGSQERGLTLVELMAVLFTSALLLVPVVRFVASTRNSMLRQQVNSNLLANNSRLQANLRSGLVSTDLVMADFSGMGGPSFTALRTLVRSSLGSGAPTPVANSAPMVAKNAAQPNLMGASSDPAAWGNELFYVASLEPVTFTVCITGCSGSPSTGTVQESVSVDRLQLVYVYLAQDPESRLPSLPGGGLRLVEWRSVPYAAFSSLTLFSGIRLTNTVSALLSQGYAFAFDKDDANVPEDAFYALSNSPPNLFSNASAAPSTLTRSAWGYVDEYDLALDLIRHPSQDRGRVRRRGSSGAWTGPADYMVALNSTTATTNAAWRLDQIRGPGRTLNVPAYAQAERGGVGFPGGFEVSLWGRPYAREVVIRTVLVATSGADPKAPPKTWPGHEAMSIFSVKNAY